MSNTISWTKRAQNYRYSQDDRTLSWKFRNELEPLVNSFLDNPIQQSYTVGTYNINKEPWRMAAIVDYRKYSLKIIEKKVDGDNTEITLVKKKLREM
jgi:hypothetical protein